MRLLITVFIVTFSLFANAQVKKTELDKSPMDMSYSPNDYPISKFQGKVNGDPSLRVTYSRPQKKGRTIFGGELKYGEVWRLGANESTELLTFKTVRLNGKKISKGRYTLACIPYENKWTIIVNKDTDSWGTFSYDSKKDLLRADFPITKNTEIVEALTIYFEDTATGSNLIIMWDDVKCVIPFTF